jgi:beta-xylosidase
MKIMFCLGLVCATLASSGTYTNPVIGGDYPDPGAIFVNGSFFVATTGEGFPIHESSTLSTWSAAGSVFGRHGGPEWAKQDFWA